MVEQGPNFGTQGEGAEEPEGEGFDAQQALEMAGFIARAPRRHPALAAITFVVVAALGIVAAVAVPNTYRASVKLLAQRSIAIRALTAGNQELSRLEWDSPVKGVQEMVLRRANVENLAKDANLVERVAQTRSSALRTKDRIMEAIFGAPSEDDKLKGIVYTLESKLSVETTDDSTVIISADWGNAGIAYDLIKLVLRNFEEARYDNDVAVINDSIAVLEEHAKQESGHVDAELAAYQKVVAERVPPKDARGGGAAPARVGVVGGVRTVVAAAAPAEVPDLEATRALEAKRAEIHAIEEAHARAVDTLRQQLVQAQLTLTPMHPTVIALQKQLDALSETPPELVHAREDERSLMAQIAAPRAAAVAPAVAPAPAPAVRPFESMANPAAAAIADAGAGSELALGPRTDPSLDGQVRLAESKLAAAIRTYEDSVNRVDAARSELDIARAASKHRFTVVTPPEMPLKPKKPIKLFVGLGAIAGAVVLALLFSCLADYAKGTMLEPWQVRRALKTDILCELDRPQLEGPSS